MSAKRSLKKYTLSLPQPCVHKDSPLLVLVAAAQMLLMLHTSETQGLSDSAIWICYRELLSA